MVLPKKPRQPGLGGGGGGGGDGDDVELRPLTRTGGGDDVDLRPLARTRGIDPDGVMGRSLAHGRSAKKSVLGGVIDCAGGGLKKMLVLLLVVALVALMVASSEKDSVAKLENDIKEGGQENASRRWWDFFAGDAPLASTSSEVHPDDPDSSSSAGKTDALKEEEKKRKEEERQEKKKEEEREEEKKKKEEGGKKEKREEEDKTKDEEEEATDTTSAGKSEVLAPVTPATATAFCGTCEYMDSHFTCNEKMKWTMSKSGTSEKEWKEQNLQHCQGSAGGGPTPVTAVAPPKAPDPVITAPKEEATAVSPPQAPDPPAAAVAEATPEGAVLAQGYQPTEMVKDSNYVLPGTEGAPPLSAAAGRPYYPVLNHFQHRNPSSPYAEKWGRFTFKDPDAKWDGKMRPQPDFRAAPNRDVKNADFPQDAWQRDEEYMTDFLAQAKLLVNRSMEAVYAEYGVGIPQDGSVTFTEEQWSNRENFSPWLVKDTVDNIPVDGLSWTTKQSLEGIARRFIHHIMTGDTFKLVLGGHSAAAGHGAGFNQSYIIEAGHVLEPVFAHLGVDMRAYNFAQGGLGTFQQSMAGMDLRGKETDWILWDSRMTEKSETLVNFFLRQALISGNRSPVLMGDGVKLKGFHDIAGAAVAAQQIGARSWYPGWIPPTLSDEQVKQVPWAAQYLRCEKGGTADCKKHEYTAGCWVEREDFTPRKQDAAVGGRAGWHPGNRIHKVRGRQIALVVLRTLDYALDKWKSLGEKGYPVAEEHWHVNDYYKSIREKAVNVEGCWGDVWKIGQKRHLSETGEEEKLTEDSFVQAAKDKEGHRKLEGDDFWPSRLCNLPLQGRSLFSPRHNPLESSLLTIMRPNAMGDIDPGIKTSAYMAKPCYQAPDRPASWTVPDAAEPFAPLIGGARHLTVDGHKRRQLRNLVDRRPLLKKSGEREPTTDDNEGTVTTVGTGYTYKARETHFNGNAHAGQLVDSSRALRGEKSDHGSFPNHHENTTRMLAPPSGDEIIPGLGLSVNWGLTGVCDGSSHHWCDKSCGSTCLMSGTQDHHGMICFNGLSGWLVFDVKNVQHGFIGARMEPWHASTDTPITKGWTSVNNGGKGNYETRGRKRKLLEEDQERARIENAERIVEGIEEDTQFAEGGGDHRRLGGGQSCGKNGDYTFEWAINGEIVSWTQAEFCERFTRLAYNFDVMKFMDDETKKGDFELAMRISSPGSAQVMCITHLYWA